MTQELITDDDILRFTQGTRRKFVDFLLAKGFPTDPKEQNVLLSALGDMDRAALGNKRIGAAERANESDRMVAQAIAKLSSHYGTVNPLMGAGDPSIVATIPQPELTLLPSANPVPGEKDIGLDDNNYENFVKDFE